MRGPVPVDRGTTAAAARNEAGSGASRGTGQAAEPEELVSSSRPARPACQPRDGRISEEVLERYLDVERVADAATELDGQERVAAALEEMSCAPIGSPPSKLVQISARAASIGPRGGTKSAPAAGRACSRGPGRACRSIFPFGVSGRASKKTNAEGTMYSGIDPSSHRRSSAAMFDPRRPRAVIRGQAHLSAWNPDVP